MGRQVLPAVTCPPPRTSFRRPTKRTPFREFAMEI
jgi:hypothetical protein